MFCSKDNCLVWSFDSETLRIEPWGQDALRVRATKNRAFADENWALLEPEETNAKLERFEGGERITNGNITATVTKAGKITFTDASGRVLLEEFVRNRKDIHDPHCSALQIQAREFRPILGGGHELSARFESDPNERIFGMGQYQQPFLNLKGCELELAHRNSQASVPFCISSLGYGLLWNNPSIGRASFSRNVTTFYAQSTAGMDYWLCAGKTPKDIQLAYARATGFAPPMPEYGLGFWQCKLRYRTQEELLGVAREYKRRGLPISVIVIDFFHWTHEGDWKFDLDYWPDPEGMVRELKEMGIELMVSIWPTVDRDSENYLAMIEGGHLIRVDRGNRLMLNDAVLVDVTSPAARAFFWDRARENYYEKGIRIFWLDEAEPEYSVYDFDNYRYHLGPNVQIGNVYPVHYAQTFFEGMRGQGQQDIVNLIRCAWAGSQRFGALVWSGDIHSSFASFRNQLCAGINMGVAGIPWWTTDIGGFHGGNAANPEFVELFIRWFQWGAFCPVMRLHGVREPGNRQRLGNTGGGISGTGADNEVWSFGEKAYEVCTEYLFLRERMKEYIRGLMLEAHEKGAPPMRALFIEFPDDQKAWHVEDQYMFGASVLVAPVLELGARSRDVYLPAGADWICPYTGARHTGGQTIHADAPLERMPVFVRAGDDLGFEF